MRLHPLQIAQAQGAELHAPGGELYFLCLLGLALLFLMLFSTVVDYFAAIGIGESQSQRRRKTILVVSICLQLGLLGVFKYFDFFARELSGLLALSGFHVSLPILGLLLPVGISFYTFQTMSYTIDVYRGQFRHTRNFASDREFPGPGGSVSGWAVRKQLAALPSWLISDP